MNYQTKTQDLLGIDPLTHELSSRKVNSITLWTCFFIRNNVSYMLFELHLNSIISKDRLGIF